MISRRFATPALAAASEGAEGAVTLAGGSAELAVSALRRAVRGWLKVGAPYEAARARLTLARAHLARSDGKSATTELRAARDVFERLGAVLQSRIATDLLRRGRPGARELRDVAQRVSQTLVFTDIVDSTRTIALIGDDAWVLLRRWHDTTLRSIFTTHGGNEIDHAGDGFFVVFADPSAAIRCAVDIQRSLEQPQAVQRVRPAGPHRNPHRGGGGRRRRLPGGGGARCRAHRRGRDRRRDPGQRADSGGRAARSMAPPGR